jgi:hypothetical protein
MVHFRAVCDCCTRTDIVWEHLEDTLRICDVSAMGLYSSRLTTICCTIVKATRTTMILYLWSTDISRVSYNFALKLFGLSGGLNPVLSRRSSARLSALQTKNMSDEHVKVVNL